MDYSFDQLDDIVVLSVEGNVLTGVHNNEILEEVSECIQNGLNRMVVFLGDSRFINSNGLNLLLNILTKCRKSGGEVVLANTPAALDKLLVMTKLNSIFVSRETKAEAIDFLKEK